MTAISMYFFKSLCNDYPVVEVVFELSYILTVDTRLEPLGRRAHVEIESSIIHIHNSLHKKWRSNIFLVPSSSESTAEALTVGILTIIVDAHESTLIN